MATSVPIAINMGGDLSANRRSGKIYTCEASKVCIEMGWTATGTPVGTITIEGSNNSNAASGQTLVNYEGGTLVTTSPAGTAASFLLEFECNAEYIEIVYTAGTGGTGAVFTDISHSTGTPSVKFKE